MTETVLDLAAIVAQESFDVAEFDQIKEFAFAKTETLHRFRDLIAALQDQCASGQLPAPKHALKLGMCLLALGRLEDGFAWLEKAPESGHRSYYLGSCLRELRRYPESEAAFAKAAAAGLDEIECQCQRAESFLVAGDSGKAREIIDKHRAQGQENPHWNYAAGRLAQESGDTLAALDHFEKAVELDDHHAHAMFHLAYLLDLHGTDDRSFELYHRCAELPFVHSHALINLAILHEDRGQFEKAASCLRRVLAVDPTHARARLYLKDVMAAGEMFIDELEVHEREKRSAVLDIPISDFELSVRSRNCLKKMNINSLGDLLRTSEVELLAYKNFGETSLKEIRAMLKQKGLSLGQLAHEKAAHKAAAVQAELTSSKSSDFLGKTVADLELSVRSRKCLQRLGINTVGELACRTEAELLGSRNFGQTSLTEIKNRLTEVGLSLRQPKE